jgi:hypothetical protein
VITWTYQRSGKETSGEVREISFYLLIQAEIFNFHIRVIIALPRENLLSMDSL